MRTQVVVFPFDLFGSAGTAAGAQLLGDTVREILDDTAKETRPCRAAALRNQLRIREASFETMEQVTGWRKRGRQFARQAFKAGEFLLWLGGNHLSVLPVLEELGTHQSTRTLVVQFDAHLDIYSFHDTTEELSHGNFLIHAEEPLPRLVHVGHRDLFLTSDVIAKTFSAVFSATDVATQPDRVVKALQEAARSADRIWIDIDSDVFDPAHLPGVQHPLPFGLTPLVFLRFLEAIWSPRVLGVSVSEFDPGRDVRDTSLNLLGWLIESLLLKHHQS